MHLPNTSLKAAYGKTVLRIAVVLALRVARYSDEGIKKNYDEKCSMPEWFVESTSYRSESFDSHKANGPISKYSALRAVFQIPKNCLTVPPLRSSSHTAKHARAQLEFNLVAQTGIPSSALRAGFSPGKNVEVDE